jgi:hypothetical protein
MPVKRKAGCGTDVMWRLNRGHAVRRERSQRRWKWLVITVLGGLALSFWWGNSGATRAAAAAPSRTYVVQPGDTVWSIAVRIAPQSDPRAVCDEIESINHLDGRAHIEPGQVLKLPDLP